MRQEQQGQLIRPNVKVEVKLPPGAEKGLARVEQALARLDRGIDQGTFAAGFAAGALAAALVVAALAWRHKS
jgi:hypothetical protein